MPIALSRKETAPVSLRSDEALPEGERPAFLFHYLTREDVREHARILAEAEAVDTDAEAEKLLDRAILLGLAGWKNMRTAAGETIPYDPAALDKLLTAREKLELAVRYPHAVASAENLRGNFGSPSSSATAGSAPAAEGGGAATNPAPSAP